MRRSRCLFLALTLLAACWWGAVAYGQLSYAAFDIDHPAIAYHSTASSDAAAVLNGRLQSGAQQLQFEGPSGYLRSLLRALDIPVESQMVVYSKSSLQSRLISPQNPRTIFFNDSTSVGWVASNAGAPHLTE